MLKVAAGLLIAGIGILFGYWMYAILNVIYIEQDMPTIIKMAVVMVLLGLILLVSVLVWNRISARKNEHFEEIEY